MEDNHSGKFKEQGRNADDYAARRGWDVPPEDFMVNCPFRNRD